MPLPEPPGPGEILQPHLWWKAVRAVTLENEELDGGGSIHMVSGDSINFKARRGEHLPEWVGLAIARGDLVKTFPRLGRVFQPWELIGPEHWTHPPGSLRWWWHRIRQEGPVGAWASRARAVGGWRPGGAPRALL